MSIVAGLALRRHKDHRPANREGAANELARSYRTRSGYPERVRGRKYHQRSPNTPEGLAAPAGSTSGDAGTPR